ncbi:MAG TPA: chemotaxis protein, partial [Bradyrhizobium sp.]|nr:chemotaxis protein [Bradyrhizobium sp.]
MIGEEFHLHRKDPKMKGISVTLPAIVSALVMIGALSAGISAYQAYEQRQQSEAFLEVNHISQLLLRSAGQWAVERGLTNAPLKSPDALPAELRPQIVETRQAADRAFSEAAQLLHGNPAMNSA